MPSPPSEPLAFLNGAIIPFRDAQLPVYDLGIVQGATITERLRTFAHQPGFVAEHLHRLEVTLTQLGWVLETPLSDLPEIINSLVRHNVTLIEPETDLAIVLFCTGGQFTGDANGFGSDFNHPTLCIYTAPLPLSRFANWYQSGIPLELTGIQHIPPQSLDPRIKTRSRMHWYLADRQARSLNQTGSAQALLLDAHGCVTETSSGNLFVRRGQELWTPRRETTLAGISQQFVIELAQNLGYHTERRDMTPEAICQEAEEVFLTSSTYCIAPVRSLSGKNIGHTFPGQLTQQLQLAWSRHVGMDVVAQSLRG